MVYMLLQSGMVFDQMELTRENLEFSIFPSLQRRAASTGIYGELGQPRLPANVPVQYLVSSDAMYRYSVIAMNRACLVIRRVWLENLPNGELAMFGDVEPYPNSEAGNLYAQNTNVLQIVPRPQGPCYEDGHCEMQDVITFDAVPMAA